MITKTVFGGYVFYFINIIYFCTACFDVKEPKRKEAPKPTRVSEPLNIPTKAEVLEEYSQYEPLLIQDIDQIQNLTHLFSNTCTKNVGEWMHPKMRWDVTGTSRAEKIIKKWQKNKEQSPLPNIDSYFRKDGKKKKNWLENLDSYPKRDDWTWVDEIVYQYDCWDIDEDSPRSLLQWQEPTDVAIPNWIGLQSWVKYRLIMALQSNDEEGLSKGLSSTRKWVKIMFTTENLVGEMIGIALLKIEREAHEESKKRGMNVEWDSVSEEQEKTLRRVLFGSVNYFALWTPQERQDVADKIPFGICASVNDGMTLSWFTLGYLAENKKQELKHIDDWSTKCRLQWMKQKWKERTKVPPRKMQKDLCTYLKQEDICSKKNGATSGDIVEALDVALNIASRSFWVFS